MATPSTPRYAGGVVHLLTPFGYSSSSVKFLEQAAITHLSSKGSDNWGTEIKRTHAAGERQRERTVPVPRYPRKQII